MNTAEFCTSLNMELNGWREELAKVSGQFDRAPSIDKYRVSPQIEGLHILLAELDARITELKTTCPTGEWMSGTDVVGRPRLSLSESGDVHVDYDFGG
ncbi:MAG: hypothetical protein AB1634_07350 [Thermodesulfobacteriota bacterium]